MSASSLRTLASTLDDLVSNGSLVSESAETLVVSELTAAAALTIAAGFADISWPHAAFDRADSETDLEDLHDGFGPFRVTARKPAREDGVTLLVTASGFSDMLSGEQDTGVVAVVGLGHPIVVEDMWFVPEDGTVDNIDVGRSFRSPRTLVREYGAKRIVPRSIGRWLLVDSLTWHEADERFRLWLSHAVRAILPALPTEIDQNTGAYVFRGPPRLALEALDATIDVVGGLGREGFQDLQAAARWIYELDREAETRHTLFSTEFARTGSVGTGTLNCVRENLGHALEGAKIAHAMSVAKVSADNLKALADLRKAVTEETGKIVDSARQVVGALASALAVGIGLIAVRVAANAPSLLIMAVMAVVAAYIFVVIYSGYRFVALQRGLRDMWRNQIYRFLSPDEYEKLVVKPGRDAEKILTRVSWVGGIAVTVTFAVVAWVALVPHGSAADRNPEPEPSRAETSADEVDTPETETAADTDPGPSSLMPTNPTQAPEPEAEPPPFSERSDTIPTSE